MKLGCHVSISGSIDKSFQRAQEKNCNTFQIFTKNPRGWAMRDLQDEEIHQFKVKVRTMLFNPIFAHISYLPNLSSQNAEVYEKSLSTFLKELERCSILNIPYFVIHGGSYRGGTFEEGIKTYVNSILKGIEKTGQKVKILIENSSGAANSLTGEMHNISKILNEVGDKNAVGICFDTCHAFGAGYNLSTEKGIKQIYETIENTFGINRIDLLHANDSKADLGSNRDIHEHIGVGKIGKNGFEFLVNHDFFGTIPWILETPINEERGDKENIDYILSLKKE